MASQLNTGAKRWTFILLGQFVLILVLLEAGVRFFPAALPKAVRYIVSIPSVWHPLVGVAQRPNHAVTVEGDDEFQFHVKTSDLGLGGPGFRDNPPLHPKPIVVVGDSFTWGVGVEHPEIWTERLEATLKKDVVNMAYPGYGTTQERIVLEEWGMKLNPSGVILQVYVGNDFWDNESWRDTFQVGKGPWKSFEMKLRAFLHANVRLYSLFKYYVVGMLFGKGTYASRNRDRPVEYANGFPDAGVGWKIMQQELLRIAALCRARGAWFKVIVFPGKEQVYASAEARRTDLNLFSWNRLIFDFCQKQGIAIEDLSHPLIAEQQARLYWVHNGHFAPRGHDVVAKTLARTIPR